MRVYLKCPECGEEENEYEVGLDDYNAYPTVVGALECFECTSPISEGMIIEKWEEDCREED